MAMVRNAEAFRARYGPWAVVAGASEGLGAAFSRALAGRGLNLVLVARRQEVLEGLADELTRAHGIVARAVVADLAARDAAREVVRACADLDAGLLVYNAAFSVIGSFLASDVDEHVREIRVNCRTPMMLAHAFGQRFVARGRGGVILMSSMAGFQGTPLVANYGATKAYNLVLAEGLWDEWRGLGVDVLASCAGSTRTPNFEKSLPTPGSAPPGPIMDAADVAEQTLGALGRGPTFIPGRGNRVASLLLHRLLPRRTAVRIMGRSTRRLYEL